MFKKNGFVIQPNNHKRAAYFYFKKIYNILVQIF